MSPARMSPQEAAYVEWTEHPRYKYRGCAPDVDEPRLAAGSPGLDGEGRPVRVALDAWLGPDVDGGESQQARTARVEAAREVCLGCPVMVQCDAYAMVAPERADGLRGGRTGREREALVKARSRVRRVRVAVPVAQLRTPQKLAVLAALAVHVDEYQVAIETGLDVRKANWQRARLVSGLGLEPSASRMDLLGAAVKAGLVDGSLVVADDGRVPAIPSATRKLLIEVEGQFLLWPSDPSEVKDTPPVRRTPGRARAAGLVRSGRLAGSGSLRAKFRQVRGQEAFDVPVTVPAGWADVAELFPMAGTGLGVAA